MKKIWLIFLRDTSRTRFVQAQSVVSGEIVWKSDQLIYQVDPCIHAVYITNENTNCFSWELESIKSRVVTVFKLWSTSNKIPKPFFRSTRCIFGSMGNHCYQTYRILVVHEHEHDPIPFLLQITPNSTNIFIFWHAPTVSPTRYILGVLTTVQLPVVSWLEIRLRWLFPCSAYAPSLLAQIFWNRSQARRRRLSPFVWRLIFAFLFSRDWISGSRIADRVFSHHPHC